MKKILLSFIAVLTALMLTACGMTAEEIDTAITQIDTTYQAGTYEQAQEEITALEKEYKKMSDEQKGKFDELKSSVEYAAKSAETIKYGFDSAQNLYDQKMYYEAQAELRKVEETYTMPPAEKKVFEEKKTAINEAIKNLKITEAFQRVEAAYNSKDYNTATSELNNIDLISLSEEQKGNYQSWQTKIAEAKAKAEAEAKAKAEAAAKAKAEAGISQSKVIEIALNRHPGYSVGSVSTQTYNGIEVYSVYMEKYDYDIGEKDEVSVLINKKTGAFVMDIG